METYVIVLIVPEPKFVSYVLHEIARQGGKIIHYIGRTIIVEFTK